MTQANFNSATTFGFLTVVEIASLGHCGGLLVVSGIGRPIEFHCTAPVRTNRAQEIIYGKTYQGFLFADQIGKALVEKASREPDVFVTDCADALPISEWVDSPLVFTPPADSSEPFDGRGLKQLKLGEQTLFAFNGDQAKIRQVELALQAFVARLPLDEPFERIRQAIEEAHQVSRAA